MRKKTPNEWEKLSHFLSLPAIVFHLTLFVDPYCVCWLGTINLSYSLQWAASRLCGNVLVRICTNWSRQRQSGHQVVCTPCNTRNYALLKSPVSYFVGKNYEVESFCFDSSCHGTEDSKYNTGCRCWMSVCICRLKMFSTLFLSRFFFFFIHVFISRWRSLIAVFW